MQKERKNPAIIMIVLGLLLFSSIQISSHQFDSLKNYNIDDVIILASRYEKPLSAVGKSVSIISNKDIENSVYLSPSGILSPQDGINIIGNGQTPGSMQSIFMRGANPYQTVIMIDATVNKVTDPNAYQNFDKDKFEKLDLIGKVGYTTNNLDVFSSFKRTNQKSDIDAGAFSDDDNYTIEFEQNLFYFSVSYKLNEMLKFVFVSGYTKMKRTAVNDSSVITRRNQTLKPETTESFEIAFKQTLTDNISFSLSSFNTSVNNNIEYIYLRDEWISIDELGFANYMGDT